MNLLHKNFITPEKVHFENPFFIPDNNYLEEYIKITDSPDPSLNSLGYLKMTSRKGIRCFKGNYCDIVFSLHPNDSSRYIIYPNSKKNFHLDIIDLSNILRATGKKVEIVRVAEENALDLARLVKGKIDTKTDLDFAYPVQIVRNSDLLNMYGTKYLKFRNKINAIKKEGISCHPTNFNASELVKMRTVLKDWASIVFKNNQYEQSEYINYFIENLVPHKNISGLFATLNNTVIGFTIWEKPLKDCNTANSLIHCCLHHRGVSEFLHHEMSKSLYHDDIEYLSLGGAETKSLNDFKRKMNPSKSIQLVTVKI